MRYRQLGTSDLYISEISIGTWGIGEGVQEESMRRSLFNAIDLGVNFIDTSNSYAAGRSESWLGQTLKDISRSSYLLATKVFFPVPPGEGGLSAKAIRENIDLSLARLKVDYIDLYQCHRYDDETPLFETMTALTEIVRQGKARYIGFSEWTPAQIKAALDMTDLVPFVSSQPQYSLLWRDPEMQIFPLCANNGIGNLAWSPLAQGILSGRYRPGQLPKEGSRAANSHMNGYLLRHLFHDKNLLAVAKLLPIAQSQGLTLPQLALAWVLRQECVTSAIIGVSQPEHVSDNVLASGITLAPEVITRIDEILTSIKPER